MIGKFNEFIVEKEEELSDLYSGKLPTSLELVKGYFHVLNSNGEYVDSFCVKGGRPEICRYKTIDDKHFGLIKPLNNEQKCLFHLLSDSEAGVKLITGSYGSGKTYLTVAFAMHLLETNVIDKIVWVRNNIAVKDTGDLGALPGTELEKLLPFCGPLIDHLGGLDALHNFISSGSIEVVHLGHLRGRDIRNSIILCSEAENLTRKHVQLLIGRVGKNSQLWLEGDIRQTDKKVFENDNGLKAAVDKLIGNPLFGYVHLPKSERSDIAKLADLLD